MTDPVSAAYADALNIIGNRIELGNMAPSVDKELHAVFNAIVVRAHEVITKAAPGPAVTDIREAFIQGFNASTERFNGEFGAAISDVEEMAYEYVAALAPSASPALTPATERAEKAEAELAEEKRKRGEEKAKILRQRESLRGCQKSIKTLTAERDGQRRRADRAEARAERLRAALLSLGTVADALEAWRDAIRHHRAIEPSVMGLTDMARVVLAAIAADTPTQEADHG